MLCDTLQLHMGGASNNTSRMMRSRQFCCKRMRRPTHNYGREGWRCGLMGSTHLPRHPSHAMTTTGGVQRRVHHRRNRRHRQLDHQQRRGSPGLHGRRAVFPRVQPDVDDRGCVGRRRHSICQLHGGGGAGPIGVSSIGAAPEDARAGKPSHKRVCKGGNDLFLPPHPRPPPGPAARAASGRHPLKQD